MADKRLIDANSAKLAASDYKIFRCQLGGLMDVAEFIEDQPTVDAVEVVRCRDCKRCFKHTTKRNRQKMWICMRNEVDVCVRPDDFCSYGERKDSNGNG